jgi:hypothetical protein
LKRVDANLSRPVAGSVALQSFPAFLSCIQAKFWIKMQTGPEDEGAFIEVEQPSRRIGRFYAVEGAPDSLTPVGGLQWDVRFVVTWNGVSFYASLTDTTYARRVYLKRVGETSRARLSNPQLLQPGDVVYEQTLSADNDINHQLLWCVRLVQDGMSTNAARVAITPAGAKSAQLRYVNPGSSLTIGRSRFGITDMGVSATHLVIRVDEHGDVFAVDRSRSGTRLIYPDQTREQMPRDVPIRVRSGVSMVLPGRDGAAAIVTIL